VKRSKDPVVLVRRDARSVVADGQHRSGFVLGEGEGNVGGGVPGGVAGDVAHRAGELPGVAADLSSRDPTGVDGDPGGP